MLQAHAAVLSLNRIVRDIWNNVTEVSLLTAGDCRKEIGLKFISCQNSLRLQTI